MLRAAGLECATCAAVVHSGCAAELGHCHPEAVLLFSKEAESAGGSDATTRGELFLGLVVLGALAVPVVASALLWGLGGAQLTLVAGGLGLAALAQGPGALFRESAEGPLPGTPVFSWAREPFACFGAVAIWTSLGLALCALALLPLLIPAPS